MRANDMKVTIQARSGNHSFDCDAGENLLYAGLRHGIGLPYECATGTCGTCKARVIEGQAITQWTDAPGLSYVRAERGEVLMCQAAPRGDCTLKVPVKLADAMAFVPAFRQGRICGVQTLTHEVIAFTLEMDAAIDFDAGQFVVVYAPGVAGGRAYSMTNYSRCARRLDFVVKRKPGGQFSGWLFDGDVAGAALRVFGPLGRATFRPQEDKNVLCIGGGSGIAGMMSIVSRACQDGYFKKRRGHVFFGVPTAGDVFFLDRLSAFVEAFPGNLEVTVALSEEDVTPALSGAYPGLDFVTGFVHAVASQRMAGRYDNVAAYVGGPPPMVDGALRMLILEARLPGGDVRYDKFT